jgi:hypothetical protein
VAGRLARREVRRHPWRHLLVTVLILVPVLAALAAFSAVSTWRDTTQRRAAFAYPDPSVVQSNWLVAHQDVPPDATPSDIRASLELPPDVRTELAWSGADWLITDQARRGGGGPVLAGTAVDEARPGSAHAGRYVVQSGRLPTAPDEIFLTQPLADAGRWSIGDSVSTARSDHEFTVVGTGLRGDRTEDRAAVVTDQPDAYWTTPTAGIDEVDAGADYAIGATPIREVAAWVPNDDTRAALLRWRYSGLSEFNRSNKLDARTGPGMVLASATICAVVAIVASAALAISGRRQLRTIGLLATVGTDPVTVRRSMLLQGALPGLVAGFTAVTVTVVGAAVINRVGVLTHATGVYGAQIVVSTGGALVAVGLAVASGIGAAWQPARTASRIPTLSALAGRRPVGPVPTGIPVAGAVLWAVGACLVILAFGADGVGTLHSAQPFLVIGAVAALAFGTVGLAPAAVALLDRLAGRFRGTWRMGLRGLARNRMQSAATVAAIAVVLAVPVGLLTTRNGLDDRTRARHCCDDAPTVVSATTAVGAPSGTGTSGQPVPVLAGGGSTVHAVFHGALRSTTILARVDELHAVLGPESAVIRTVPLVDQSGSWQYVATIDESEAREVLEPWAADAIENGKAIALRGAGADVTFTAGEDTATFPTISPPDNAPAYLDGTSAAYLVGTGALHGVGSDRPSDGLMVVRADPLTADEAAALMALPGVDRVASSARSSESPPTLAEIRSALAMSETGAPIDPAVRIEVSEVGIDNDSWRRPSDDRTVADEWDSVLLVLAVATGGLALLVLTITLSLRSVDGDADRRAALAAGVAPVALRRQRAFEGVVLALVGAVLAVPLGWIPITAARVGADGFDEGTGGLVPWVSLPGWAVVPFLLAPAVLAAVVWTVVPALAVAVRSARGRAVPDDLVPRW